MTWQIVLSSIVGLASGASLVMVALAFRTSRKLSEDPARPPTKKEFEDLNRQTAQLEKDAAELADFAKLVRAGGDIDGFAVRKTIVRYWQVRCPHCRQMNRLDPEKVGAVRCGACGLPVRLTIEKKP